MKGKLVIVQEAELQRLHGIRRRWLAGWTLGVLSVLGTIASFQVAVNHANRDDTLAEAREKIEQLRSENSQLRSSSKEQLDAQHALDRDILEAQRLGIVAAVERTGLPAQHRRRISEAIVRSARENNLDPRLVVAVIMNESSFNSWATSHVGAKGLMQVMPATGRWLADRHGAALPRAEALYDPEINIQLGTIYLAELVRSFRSVEHALVAYNAGPALAKRILANPESRQRFMAGYPKKVMETYWKLSDSPEDSRLARN